MNNLSSNFPQRYIADGAPALIPKLLIRPDNQKIILLGPPGIPGWFITKDNKLKYFHTPSDLLYNENWSALLASSNYQLIWEAKRQKDYLLCTSEGFCPATIEHYREIVRGKIKMISLEALNNKSLQELLIFLGYLALPQERHTFQPLTIKDCLQLKSNHYLLAEEMWKFITGVDFVEGNSNFLSKLLFNNPPETFISIVIPCYLANETIEDTIISVIESSRMLPAHVSIEIIVVDDKNTLNKDLSQYHSVMTLINTSKQQYCGGARNIGLSAAKGEIILFLDADTYLDSDYLINHWLRHQMFPNLILVSMRDYMDGKIMPSQKPSTTVDTRWQATYYPDWQGIHCVNEAVTVMPLKETDSFRRFGHYTTVGPTDLPFMVKGNNMSLQKSALTAVSFSPLFKGWGPEDVCLAAKMIARGYFVVPVLSTGVFHINHKPRSGSKALKEKELKRNLEVYSQLLNTLPYSNWEKRL